MLVPRKSDGFAWTRPYAILPSTNLRRKDLLLCFPGGWGQHGRYRLPSKTTLPLGGEGKKQTVLRGMGNCLMLHNSGSTEGTGVSCRFIRSPSQDVSGDGRRNFARAPVNQGPWGCSLHNFWLPPDVVLQRLHSLGGEPSAHKGSYVRVGENAWI